MKLRNKKKIYFASDNHLGSPNFKKSLEREKVFVKWLDYVRADAQEIFLLGDLIDFWFEYDKVIPKGFVRTFGKLAEICDSGIKVNFFKHKALTTTIPAQLVKKYKMPIVPVFIERFENIKFKIIFQKPIYFQDNDSIENITSKLNEVLEKMIISKPEQWIWSHNRWK